MSGIVRLICMIAVAVGGLTFTLGGIDMSPERLLVPVVAALMLLHVMSGRNFTLPGSILIYAGWLSAVILSTLFSDNPLMHLNGFIITVTPFVFYIFFAQAESRFIGNGTIVKTILLPLSVATIVFYAIWLTTGSFAWLIDRGRIKLTMAEPNILGAYLAILMLIHLSYFRNRFIDYLIHGLSLIALLMTASKAPYVAYALGFVYFIVRSGVLLRPVPMVLTVIGVAVGVAGAMLSADTLVGAYESNLARQDAVNIRMLTIGFAWEQFLRSPIIGNGPLDFTFTSVTLLSRMGSTNANNLWIWQVWVAVLHDEGIYGLFWFVLLIVVSLYRASRVARAGNREFVGYISAAIAMIVASQTTTLHLTALFGIVIGLLNSAIIADPEDGNASAV